MGRSAGLVVAFVFFVAIRTVVLAQTDATKADTIRMSQLLSERTGIVTIAAVLPRGDTHDIDVQFNGAVTNYKGVMGVLIGAIGETTRRASYKTEWCYITTREQGTERILTSDVRRVQALALQQKLDESWDYFVSKKSHVRR
jgi:hypothetical protein